MSQVGHCYIYYNPHVLHHTAVLIHTYSKLAPKYTRYKRNTRHVFEMCNMLCVSTRSTRKRGRDGVDWTQPSEGGLGMAVV